MCTKTAGFLGFFLRFATPILLLSCDTPTHLSEQALLEYVANEANGLQKSVSANNFTLTLQYKPTDFLVAQELKANAVRNEQDIMKHRSHYSQYAYFVLQLSAANKEALRALPGGYPAYSNMLQTLSFRMNDYAKLLTSKQDTILLADFSYTPLFGLTKNTTVLLVFDKEKLAKCRWIELQLAEFGLGVGKKKFRFRMKDLQQTPRLDFNTV